MKLQTIEARLWRGELNDTTECWETTARRDEEERQRKRKRNAARREDTDGGGSRAVGVRGLRV